MIIIEQDLARELAKEAAEVLKEKGLRPALLLDDRQGRINASNYFVDRNIIDTIWKEAWRRVGHPDVNRKSLWAMHHEWEAEEYRYLSRYR